LPLSGGLVAFSRTVDVTAMETVEPHMPSKTPRRLPRGATDCHAHVFGPRDRFPFKAPLSYAAPLAPLPVYLEMLRGTGMERGVLIQPAPYGHDPSAMLDALRREPARLRGVAVAEATVSDKRLEELSGAGVRALRFVEMLDPSGSGRYKGSIGTDQLVELAPRMKELGLHAQLWAKCAQFPEFLPRLLPLGIDIAIDHMGWLETALGVTAPGFQTLVSLLAEGRIWVKLSACRNSKLLPDYPDLRPFHDALIKANPDRLLWGSDWPFVRMGALTPDPSHLVDLLHEWVSDAGLIKKILVDNPAVLFGFPSD
jgi:2-pyrone-4,6-dicarboxylate lactonase